MKDTIKLPPVDDLLGDAIDVKPVDFDWSKGYGETWEVVRPNVDCWSLEQCRKWLDERSKDPGDETDVGKLREMVLDAMQEGEDYIPMMGYYYRLPNLSMPPEEAQTRLMGLPLVVVMVHGAPVMALTGGGMDLSWQICEAYMTLGYLPPLHFCRLPRMAGMTLTPIRCWTLAGCECSARVAKQRVAWIIEDIERTRKALADAAKNRRIGGDRFTRGRKGNEFRS